jgi:uncharacterized MAPEG superfamily protein
MMTLADICLIGAVVIAMVSIGIAKGAGRGRFDNARPRDEDFYQDPFRARARGAHQNGLEAFPIFAVAVLVAELHHARQPVVDALAVAFLVIRVGYVACYLADKASLRSILWALAFAVNLAIFFAPLWARG